MIKSHASVLPPSARSGELLFFKDFPHTDSKKVRDHDKQHMTFPSPVTPALVVAHSQTAFTFFKALLNGPPQCGRPVQFMGREFSRCIGNEVFYLPVRIFPQVKPYFRSRFHIIPVSIFAAGKTADKFPLRHDWSLCTFCQYNCFPWDGRVFCDFLHGYRFP